MRIPFTKAHGARNDFLFTWSSEAPRERRAEAAVALCDRHSGIGADGWYIVSPGPRNSGYHASIHLYNSDGSEPELSGNGTRCAAAFLIDTGLAESEIGIRTGAGIKTVRLIERSGMRFRLDMQMGEPRVLEAHLHLEISGSKYDAATVDVGNPQCAVFTDSFDWDWRSAGSSIESHPMFPNRTNVSFVRAVDEHTIDVRFWERGAGETMSSGTGSTGAAAAAIARGLVSPPVVVLTPAGQLDLRWDGDTVSLVGPAEITAGGEFYWDA